MTVGDPEWFFFSGGPGAPRYGDDPTKHAVSHDTETFVREVLQNANDQGLDEEDPVEVTFRFVSLTGDAKAEFLKALGWTSELEPRIESVGDRNDGERREQLVDRLDDPDEELRLLVVEDRNTTGLTGAWEEDSNYAALVRDELYSSKQEDTAGGSYGIGKSVLWTFSDLSTVVFNSKPAHGSGDDEGALRLIGRTKLPTHRLDGDDTTYQGAGWLCRPTSTDEGVRPESIQGESARDLADRLHVGRPEDSGTSALVVGFRDPTRDARPPLDELAEEVVHASVKFFWPAIYRGDLQVTVETPETTVEADVDAVPQIRPFVDCYRERTSNSTSLENPGDVASLDIPVDLPPRADGEETPRGHVKLAARLASPADDDTYLNNVALFRGPGMVVKYYDQRRVAFGDRNFHAILAAGDARDEGAATEADREIDRFLRYAEPPAHDAWTSTEKLRERYQRGFRTAIEETFQSVRDGLRHVVAQSTGSGEALSDVVLKKFPIHGEGRPRADGGEQDRLFDIETSLNFDGTRWRFEGRIVPLEDEVEGLTAEVSMRGVGEDGTRSEQVPIDDVDAHEESATTTDDGEDSVRIVADDGLEELTFSGKSIRIGENDLLSGAVGETQLTVRARPEIRDGDGE